MTEKLGYYAGRLTTDTILEMKVSVYYAGYKPTGLRINIDTMQRLLNRENSFSELDDIGNWIPMNAFDVSVYLGLDVIYDESMPAESCKIDFVK
jgi:hypothetical protein